jgi:hypothetical protein
MKKSQKIIFRHYEFGRIFVYEQIRKPKNDTAMKILLAALLLLTSSTLYAQKDSSRPCPTTDNLERLQGRIIEMQSRMEAAQRRMTESMYNENRALVERESTRSMELAQRQIERARSEVARNQERFVERAAEMQEHALQLRARSQELRERAEGMRKMIHEMTTEMLNDHLIEKGKPVDIEVRDGKLLLNGKEQPPAIYEKYKKYFHDGDLNLHWDPNEGIAI